MVVAVALGPARRDYSGGRSSGGRRYTSPPRGVKEELPS